MRKRKPTAVGCSIYGGLFTVGVKAAGFRVLAHLEQDKYGTDTAKLNHPELEIYAAGPTSWPERFPEPIDLVYCNPPCAVWSSVGTTIKRGSEAWREDPRLQHAYDALDLTRRYAPAVWIWESVPYALSRGRDTIADMIRHGAGLGYAAHILRFNARYLGVPQSRERVFVVLSKYRFEPEPCDYDTAVTVRDVWRNLPSTNRQHGSATKAELEVINHVPQGKSLAMVFNKLRGIDGPRNDRGHLIGRPGISNRRIELDGFANPMMCVAWHPTSPRKITVGEALRLCQLPDDWKFGPSSSTPNERTELLQRAVMPKVGAWVARAALKAIKRAEPVERGQRALVFDLRTRDSSIYEFGQAPLQVGVPRAARTVASRADRPRPPVAKKVPRADLVEKAKRICAGKTGSGAYIRELLLAGGFTDEVIVARVLKKFPGRETTVADVAWNRGKLRAAGLLR